jgi:hypothetical protein
MPYKIVRTNKKFNIVAGYKTNIQTKLVDYTNNELFKKEVRKIFPCIITPKDTK